MSQCQVALPREDRAVLDLYKILWLIRMNAGEAEPGGSFPLRHLGATSGEEKPQCSRPCPQTRDKPHHCGVGGLSEPRA